jgi:hypothetical protein
MATIKRKGTNVFTATFDSSLLTNNGGSLLIDLEISKWGSKAFSDGFLFSRYHFKFNLEQELTLQVKTKLLLGATVRITVPATYEDW